jgi:hypothetical protein
MPVHIPIGEPALDFTVTLHGFDIWVNIDERQYPHSRPYYVATIQHQLEDGPGIELDYRAPRIELAAREAMEEIVKRWGKR